MGGTYLVGRGVEVCVDHRRVHLPLLKVSGLPEFQPDLGFIIDAERKHRMIRNPWDGVIRWKTYAAFNMFSKNSSSSIFSDE
jgi:hypothetical protein